MSQELIGIIGAATVAVAPTVPAHAQVDCADWNTVAFFKAAEASDVTRCLQAGANLEARTELGWTPLYQAAWSGTGEAVTALLGAGADPNVRTEEGETPLHRAAMFGTVEAVTALLEAGADPNARDKYGYTPLHQAAREGIVEAVTALLEAGADPKCGITRRGPHCIWRGGPGLVKR